jgi:hypothetical protein
VTARNISGAYFTVPLPEPFSFMKDVLIVNDNNMEAEKILEVIYMYIYIYIYIYVYSEFTMWVKLSKF